MLGSISVVAVGLLLATGVVELLLLLAAGLLGWSLDFAAAAVGLLGCWCWEGLGFGVCWAAMLLAGLLVSLGCAVALLLLFAVWLLGWWVVSQLSSISAAGRLAGFKV